MKERIRLAVSHSHLAFGSDKYFLLDYSACGNDARLIIKLNLLEKLIEKYYNVTCRKSYLGIRELQYN